MRHRYLAPAFLLLLTACSFHPPIPDSLQPGYLAGSAESACLALYTDVDRLLVAAGVVDVQAQRIQGFPYLRVNRFLSSFKEQLADEKAVRFWLSRLYQLEQNDRYIEIRNLPLTGQQLHQFGVQSKPQLLNKLAGCALDLIEFDLGSPERLKMLQQNATVRDNYNSFARGLGLYPVTKQFVSSGIARLHKDIKQTFIAAKHDSLQTKGQLLSYGMAGKQEWLSSEEIKTMLDEASDNPLAMPLLTAEQQNTLFRQFAPVWDIDVAGRADKPGKPYWDEDRKIGISHDSATVYTLLSYTRFNAQVLIQLSYILWFPERPSTGVFDLLAGHLDGITWRVTLDTQGKVIMHDSMHNCGCYHLFLPTSTMEFADNQNKDEEALLVPAIAPDIKPGDTIHIRVASNTHYIQGVSLHHNTRPEKQYVLRDYDELRQLSYQGSSKSMFGENGIVARSSRKERFILWPMGVADPGAMRQWGHHATAFIGRRHFDEPFLLQRYFTITPSY